VLMYLSIIEFYNLGLLLLTILGIVFFGIQVSSGIFLPGKGNGVWVYGILVAIWCKRI
jgi:hypothetical protein